MVTKSAYVLHARPFQESSAILECFTPCEGIVSVVARGIKRRRSRWFGALQMFLRVDIDWIGKTELKTLTQVEPTGFQPLLMGEQIRYGLYLNELTLRLLHRNDPYPTVFQYYHDTLTKMQRITDAVAWEISLRCFEMQLVSALGYGLNAECEPDCLYAYEPDLGIVEVHDPKRSESFSGASLLALQNGLLETASQRLEAKRFMRQVLAHHLGGKPLESRKLFTKVK